MEKFNLDPITLIVILLLAIVPAIIWFSVFNRENKETLIADFFAITAGGLSTIPVLFYQKLWGKEGNFVFFEIKAINFQDNISGMFGFSSFESASSMASSKDNIGSLFQGVLNFISGGGTSLLVGYDYSQILFGIMALLGVFLGVGFLEEIFKHIVINTKFVGIMVFTILMIFVTYLFQGFGSYSVFFFTIIYIFFLLYMPKAIKFKSIDDVISVSILSAIGFSLVENIIYFLFKWKSISTELDIGSITELSGSDLSQFLGFVAIRVTIVTMIHILCSGIFGYHYGLAHFAKPELEEEIRNGRKHKVLEIFHKIIGTREDKIFMYEQFLKGLFLATMLHGIYNLIAQLNVVMSFGNAKIPLIAIIMPIYFIGGFLYLLSLLEEKENKREIGYLISSEEYVDEKQEEEFEKTFEKVMS